MKRMHWSVVAFLTLATLGGSIEVQANELMEVVNARANARAGGPTNAHDAWLLERYGALSGTRGYSNGYYYGNYKKKRKHLRYRRRTHY